MAQDPGAERGSVASGPLPPPWPGRLETVLRHSSDAVLLCDAAGTVLDGNEAAERALGTGPAGHRLVDLLPAALRAEVLAGWERLRAGELFTTAAGAVGGEQVRLHLGAVVHHEALEGVAVVWRPGPVGAAPDGRALGPADDLRRGIAAEELRLQYQPIVELSGARPVGGEALVRWQHPHRGLLPPAHFVGLAERSGLAGELGDWVLAEACRTAAEWTQAPGGPPALRVSVNLSPHQLLGDTLPDVLAAALAETGCPPERLVLEVTETAVMADLRAAVRTLTAVKDLGVGLAIDDFGTGYSSLLYLKHFPVDTIKIDRSFVAGLGRDPDDSAIVAATVALAHSVEVQCVAEGVETVEHLDLLRDMGCDFAQGFLFAQPLDLPDLRAWFAQHLPAERAARPVAAPAVPAGVRELLREGASLHTIAAALNARGSRTDRGTRWNARSVAHLVAAVRAQDDAAR